MELNLNERCVGLLDRLVRWSTLRLLWLPYLLLDIDNGYLDARHFRVCRWSVALTVMTLIVAFIIARNHSVVGMAFIIAAAYLLAGFVSDIMMRIAKCGRLMPKF